MPKKQIDPHRYPTVYRKEILVDVGRDGKLLFVDGIHRPAMARILDIEEVVLAVVSRHSEYHGNSR